MTMTTTKTELSNTDWLLSFFTAALAGVCLIIGAVAVSLSPEKHQRKVTLACVVYGGICIGFGIIETKLLMQDSES